MGADPVSPSEFAFRADDGRHTSRSVTVQKRGSQMTHTMEAKGAADGVEHWLDLS